MGLPSAKEINPYDDLDGRVACDHFLGKTQDQAEAMFREHPDLYQSDLRWMGPAAFRYYVPAAIRFLRDEAIGRQSEMICGFAGTLESRLQSERRELAPIAEQLGAVCMYIVDHYDRIGDLPSTQEEADALKEFLQKEFGKLKDVLGENCPKPEDYIDLRPRFRALWQAFSDLAQEHGDER
jgi:hypothetical protein